MPIDMSNVRSLLKAKQQEIRVEHPSASYTSSGQLRCTVCNTNIKHPSAWDGHLVSKAHRTNAARIREEQRRKKELELELELELEAKRLKRKAPEDDVIQDVQSDAKRLRVASAPQSSILPPDFFSDPSRAPFISFHDSDDENDMVTAAVVTESTPVGGDSALDQEWLQFQQSVINTPDEAATYDRATVFAEPELVSNQSEGLPTHEDAQAHALPFPKADDDERRRKEQEERELIMDRLMDEERAQEEADMKVTIMKNRLQALRKRREASRIEKSNVGVA